MALAFYTCFCLLLCFGLSVQFPAATNTSEEEADYNVTFLLPPSAHVTQQAWIGEKKCMKVLECFEITKDFYNRLRRPINFLPQDRVLIDTKFELFTKFQPMEAHYLDASDHKGIKESTFDPSHKTIFIVHGFLDNKLYGKWMESLKLQLLLYGDFNVIIVDWSKGNGAPYTQAAANSRVVGAEIAHLIKTLNQLLGVSPTSCHIIGHSLGAHIAGYAGERLKNLGRITALDPAKPYFENMPASVRIDPTDADFVDAIHTDTSSSKFLALGMSQEVGHVDFYPNEGRNQPGCIYSPIHSIFLEGLFDAVRQFVSCNHQRAVDFFTYSLNFKKSLPIAHLCNNWKDFSDGYCSDCGKNGEKCAVMGMQAEQFRRFKNDTKPAKMYLSTTGDAPFWVHSYEVTVKLAKPATDFKDRAGVIYIDFEESRNNYEKLSTKTGKLIHGASYTFLVSKKEKLAKLKGLTFKWNSNSVLNILINHYIHLDYVKVAPTNVLNKATRDKMTKKFCYTPKTAIPSGKNVFLVECS